MNNSPIYSTINSTTVGELADATSLRDLDLSGEEEGPPPRPRRPLMGLTPVLSLYYIVVLLL